MQAAIVNNGFIVSGTASGEKASLPHLHEAPGNDEKRKRKEGATKRFVSVVSDFSVRR